MSDSTCDCCDSTDAQPTDAQPIDSQSTDAQPTDRTATIDRWRDERPATDAPLPPDVARIMNRFYGRESIETLGDFVEATRAEAGGGSIAVEDLCHVDGETPHSATAADETYRFRCFYDGIALAHLAEEPVEIRTESPSGTTIELRASPDGEIDVTPSGTVMSFGIATDAVDAADGPTTEAVYESICPYVKAFPSRESYRNWAAAADGATVGIPLAAGMPIAAALTE